MLQRGVVSAPEEAWLVLQRGVVSASKEVWLVLQRPEGISISTSERCG